MKKLLVVSFVLLIGFSGTLFAQTTITTTSLPGAVVGTPYPPQVLTATGGTPPYKWDNPVGGLPIGISVTSSGVISGTPTEPSGTFNFIVEVTDSAAPTPQKTSKSLSIVVSTPLSIPTTTLPDAAVGTAYFPQTLRAAGGIPPYSWSLLAGSLPPGMSLASGVIAGTPTISGTFTFTIRAADSSIPAQGAAADLTIRVSPLITTNSPLPNGAVGVAYSQTLAVSPGTSPFAWSVLSGSLPTGLSLAADGTISGTPTAAGTFNATIIVVDSSVSPLTGSKAFTITIQPAVTITTSSPLPVAVVGAFYSQFVEATGPPSAVTWSVTSRILPPGITLSATGSLTGTPTLAGTYDFTLQAASTNPAQTATKAMQLVVNPALAITTGATLPDGRLATDYVLALGAIGGLPAYTWTNPGRGLPPGLNFSSSGVISGRPTSAGTFTFTAQVSDSFNPPGQASRAFTILITTSLTITTPSLPNAIQNLAYSQPLQASGTGPFAWRVTSGILPDGLTLTAAGLVQGTPTSLGARGFSVTVTDALGSTATQNFTITVDPPVPSLSTSLPASISPAQSTEVTLSLAAPHPAPLTGQLTLTFTSKAEVPGDDPMTQFSTGSRVASFTIAANSTTAVFPSKLLLLTGTVAGTVRLAASIENGPTDTTVATVEILPIAPQMTSVSAVRTIGGMDVQITGYATAKRVTAAEFTFEWKSGTRTQRATVSRNVEADFTNWYRNTASTPFGSSFSFLQSFTIQNLDLTTIQTITIRLTNAQGSTTTTVVPR